MAQTREPEAYSLTGAPLYAPDLAPERRSQLEAELREAEARLAESPADAERIIWVGRRQAYLGRYRDAIATYTRGLAAHPGNAKLYRHRGHRYISIREFDRAIADLQRAADLIGGQPDEIEPDGAPNRFNRPRSTLQSNIWYHLALAHYLKGDFARALPAYLECMKVSTNDDMLVATADWLYMTYRRLGREEDAARVLERIAPEMEILENDAYHKRLLMYKGLVPPEDLLDTEGADPLQLATQGYGVGNWHFYNGRKDEARRVFQKVIDTGSWAAFGYIAAEADLRREY